MVSLFSFALLADFPLDLQGNTLLLLAGGGAAALLFLLLLVLFLFRGKGGRDPESGLAEDLSTYPPPPKLGEHQVTVMTQPGRLRLIVLAPVGKKPLGPPEAVLEQVMRGLGQAAEDDKPRIRTWPPQLSTHGFAPTFFRLTKRPGAKDKPSRWVLLAGPARAGATPVLLGLAVLLDAPSKMDTMMVSELEWGEVLQVEEA
jgi:hypothetical protein